MKIAPLLVQFFYSTKQLDIPGVGRFHLDGDPPSPDEKKPEPLSGVRFENDRSVIESPALISFVSEQTGKIKALASADLDSYWQLAIQFLQIGKPFQLEGIGSLLKLQSGAYSFTPGLPVLEKISSDKEDAGGEDSDGVDYKSILYIKHISKGNWKKPAGIFLFIAGLGAAIWGGYKMSNTGAEREQTGKENKLKEENTTIIPDSTGLAIQPDTIRNFTLLSPADSVTYKFVVETANKKRALARFDFLSRNGIAIKMETKDSVVFELYFSLKALSRDTLRIRDSLTRFYTPEGKQGFVRQ